MISMISRKTIVVALTLSVAAFGCSKQKSSPSVDQALGPGAVATGNGKPIAESVFRLYVMTALRKNADDLSAEERKAAIDDLISVQLLASEAENSGLLKERTVAAQIELQRMQLTARAMATRFIEQNPASDEDLQEVYDENLPRLSGKQYKARHILVPTQDEANAVIEQLKSGKDFVALAKEHADGPTGPNGGDLGWFTADSMVEPVVTAVKAMEVGAYSTEPVKSDYGYHVILLEDTRAGEPPTLDAVRNDLKNAVDRSKLQAHLKTLMDGAEISMDSTSK
jgi:peptidyl-prolyl cis-trans isomerase C